MNHEQFQKQLVTSFNYLLCSVLLYVMKVIMKENSVSDIVTNWSQRIDIFLFAFNCLLGVLSELSTPTTFFMHNRHISYA